MTRAPAPDNVRSLPGGPARLRPRASDLERRLQWAGDISARLDTEYVLKGWLLRDTLSVLYGEPGTGKTFLALDMASHVAAGAPWHGAPVRKGNVLYIAAEGGRTFDNRVAALRHRGFLTLRSPLALTERTDADAMAELMAKLSSDHGGFAMIVVDTLARVMGTADENAAQDINRLIRSLDVIRHMTGAHVMLIHHTGKDAARGARGHSALRGAVDTEIRLARATDDLPDQIVAQATKQRDMPTGECFRFRLKMVELGFDSDGDPVTTCVIHKEQEDRR